MSSSKSRASSLLTQDPIIDFHDFLDTLHPDISGRYRIDHYGGKDEDVRSRKPGWRPRLKKPSNKHVGATSFADSQSSYGIPRQYEDALAFQNPCYKRLRCLFLVSEHPIVHAGNVRGILGVHRDRFLHLISFPYIIHPYSDFYWVWNLLVCLLLTISLIYEPFLIAFRWADLGKGPNLYLSFSFSLIMLVDALLIFRIGYKDPITSKILLDPIVIRRAYLMGKFCYNILTRFPFDSIAIIFISLEQTPQKTELTWIRITAFCLKILRFEKLHWFLHHLTISFNMSTWTTQISMHGVLILCLVHWGSCLHWLLPDVVNAYYFEKNRVYKRDSWITKLNLWNEPTEFKYMNAFLRSLGNLLCLDGGSFMPKEYEEMFTTGLMVFISVSIVSYFISIFSTMRVDFFSGDDRYNEMICCVQEYLSFRRIPLWLRQRVMAYFDGKYRGKFFPEAQLFLTISGYLKNEILLHNCKGMIENVYLFNEIPTSIMQNLVQRLTYEVYIPGDVIFTPSISRDCIIFIEEGYFGVFNQFGTCIQLLKHGDIFGEVDLLCPNIPRLTSIVTLSISNVYKLSKTEYQQCMRLYPEIHALLSVRANEKIAKNIEQMAYQFQRIDRAKRWKEVLLLGKRTIHEYYADMDAGKIPIYHMSPSALQLLHYQNYKQTKTNQRKSRNEEDGKSRNTDASEYESIYTSNYSSTNTSTV